MSLRRQDVVERDPVAGKRETVAHRDPADDPTPTQASGGEGRAD